MADTAVSVGDKQLTGIKKRQQIAQANKMIFVWVIVASVALSLCGVTIQFLFRQAAFNQKVISAKLETQGTLSNNLENVEKLKKNVDELLANTHLSAVKANDTDSNLKVVLDALPTANDGAALGASFQQVILPKSQVTTSDLTTIIAEDSTATGTETEAESTTGTPTANFTFSAAGSYAQIQSMYRDLERTIRPINVQTVTIQGLDGAIRTTVTGVTYYSPSQTVQLGKKSIKP